MTPRDLNISRLNSGGLITNYYCTSQCGHCLYRSSPRWPHEYIDTETARKNFRTVRAYGCSSLHIGGGEPLLAPDKLLEVLAVAVEEKIDIEYVETNSSWYTSPDTARELLRKLLESGVPALLVSISPFHNEYIPYCKVKGVIEACNDVGMRVFPWIEEFTEDLAALDEKRTHKRAEYEELFGEEYWDRLQKRYGVSAGGRALETFWRSNMRTTVRSIIRQGKEGCGELIGTSHFHIDLYGNYVPGLCAGLAIRREDLGLPLDPEKYKVISRLYNEGPGGLLNFAMDEYGFEPSRPAYAVKCELCHEIRKFFAVERKMKTRELQPLGHYLYG